MKAIQYTTYGLPDVLALKEIAKPAPGDDQVLIKIHAASINSWDWDLLRGKPFLTRLGGLWKPRYNILGADIAGRIEAVGKNIKQFQPEDEVMGDMSGCGWGGFAEYVCVPEKALVPKPPGMTFEEAAAIPQAAVLALQGLRYKGTIQKGQKVLINGAGGGVGTFAVQIAKSCGAEVTGVDSTRKLDMLRALGSDHVIDYTQEDFSKNGLRYDLILDVTATRSIFDYKRALNPKGIYVMIGGVSRHVFQLMFLGPLISMTGSRKMGLLLYKLDNNDLNDINALWEAGKVVPVIDSCYPLAEVAEALRYFGEGNARGKVVITM